MKEDTSISSMSKKKVSLIVSILLAILFLYAAISKILIYDTFVVQLNESPYIKEYAKFLSWAVPAVEIIIAGLLIYYRTRLIGLYSSFYLMLAFTVYVFILLTFIPQMPCACGGIIDKLGWRGHLWFNAGFTALAGLGVCLIPTSKNNLRTI